MEQIKTEEVSMDKLKDLINDVNGIQLKLNDILPNSHIIFEIISKVEVIHVNDKDTGEPKVNDKGEEIIFYKIPCRYHGKGIQPFDIMVQVGENAVKRMEEKYPDNTYVNNYAFFTKTQYGVTYPQFINVIKNYNQLLNKSDLFKPIDNNVIEEKPIYAPSNPGLPSIKSDTSMGMFELTEEENALMKHILTNDKYEPYKGHCIKSESNLLEALNDIGKREEIAAVNSKRLGSLYKWYLTKVNN